MISTRSGLGNPDWQIVCQSLSIVWQIVCQSNPDCRLSEIVRVYNTIRLSQGNNKGTFHSHDGGTYTVIYKWVLLILGKTTSNNTHIITGKRNCTIQVSAELFMTEWLCRSVPYMGSALLHNAKKTSSSEVHALCSIHYISSNHSSRMLRVTLSLLLLCFILTQRQTTLLYSLFNAIWLNVCQSLLFFIILRKIVTIYYIRLHFAFFISM